MKSANSTTYASFVGAQEIVRHRKLFTNGEYIKESFIKISVHLFIGFKNKSEIVQRFSDEPLSAKTVKDKALMCRRCVMWLKSKSHIKPKYSNWLLF